MKRSLRLLAISSIVLGAIWLVVRRRPNDFRRFVTRRFDPVVMRLGLAGGRVSPWAIIEHVGRTTGTMYRTPVYPRVFGDHVYIPLPYGIDVQWVRNIQSAGHCRLELHEAILELDEPAVVPARENPMIPATLQRAFERRGRAYLRLHVLDRVPGVFARDLSPQGVGRTPSGEPATGIVDPIVADTERVSV